MRQMESKSVIIFDIQLLADVEIIMEAVIIRIDNSHASIGRRYFQSFQQIWLPAPARSGYYFNESILSGIDQLVQIADPFYLHRTMIVNLLQ